MTKRRLTSIRLDKIAAVDQPCQEHATVAIIKRAPTPLAIAKATFEEALEGQLVASRVNQAFYQSFDGLWERNDAFRTALTDELAAGGDGSEASEAYVSSVRALVDEAVAEARKAGKEASDEDIAKALQTAAASWLATKSKPKEHDTMNITTKAALKSAVAAFDPATSPAAHVAIIQKAATDLGAEDELPAEGILAKAKPDDTDALRRENAILKLSPESRTHFDGLSEADQTAFLAKSKVDQDSEVAGRNAADPVLYKCKDGTEIRKSDGAATLALAKRLDGVEAENVELKKKLGEGDLQKRASSYSNVAENVAIDMLKSADQVGPDTDAGKAILKSLDRMNKASGGVFKSIGSTEGEEEGEGGDQSARVEFNAEVGKVAKAENISRSDAMTKVRNDNPDLFKRAYGQSEEEEAEA